MTRYKNPVVASIPAARRTAVNALLNKYDYGIDTFSIPLLNPGNQVTRYGTVWNMDNVAKKLLQGIINTNQGDLESNKTLEQHAAKHNVKIKKRTRP